MAFFCVPRQANPFAQTYLKTVIYNKSGIQSVVGLYAAFVLL